MEGNVFYVFIYSVKTHEHFSPFFQSYSEKERSFVQWKQKELRCTSLFLIHDLWSLCKFQPEFCNRIRNIEATLSHQFYGKKCKCLKDGQSTANAKLEISFHLWNKEFPFQKFVEEIIDIFTHLCWLEEKLCHSCSTMFLSCQIFSEYISWFVFAFFSWRKLWYMSFGLE